MVSVVIPVFNKADLTERCLRSVIENSNQVGEIIIIDNGSSDHTAQLLVTMRSLAQSHKLSFQVVRNETNKGFGAACNQGIRLSSGNQIAILNNDTWVMRGWDQALVNELATRGLDEVGPFFDERPLSEDPQSIAFEFTRSNANQFRKHFVPILMVFSKEAIERLKFDHGGIFDERFFVTYEDTDLLHRMKQLGMAYGQTSNCYIWHHSMGTRSTPGLLPEGYEAQGLKLFIEKWGFDPRTAEHTFFETLKRRYRKNRAKRGKF